MPGSQSNCSVCCEIIGQLLLFHDERCQGVLYGFSPAVVAIKGNFLLGLNFLVVSLYPIRVGATLMSSFLVNTALILAMSTAVIQFCSSAFASYANNTQIFDVFGNQVSHLLLYRYLAKPPRLCTSV